MWLVTTNHVKVIKLKIKIIWTGGLPHLPGVPHLIVNRPSDHHTQVNSNAFTPNQWYYCTKIHPCRFSNKECYLAFSHSITLKVKLYLPCGWAKVSRIKEPRKLLFFIFKIEVLILLQLIWINYLVNKTKWTISFGKNPHFCPLDFDFNIWFPVPNVSGTLEE